MSKQSILDSQKVFARALAIDSLQTKPVTSLSSSNIWEEKYKAGYGLRAPDSQVMRFVLPRAEKWDEILELGCGVGNNLCWLAKDGYNVIGIDSSPTAIRQAKERFLEEGALGTLQVADFTERLPFPDASFDFVVDNHSLSCVGFKQIDATIEEVHRVLKPGGWFQFTPYCSCSQNVEAGSLASCGHLTYYGHDVVFAGDFWSIEELQHHELKDLMRDWTIAHWRVVLRRG